MAGKSSAAKNGKIEAKNKATVRRVLKMFEQGNFEQMDRFFESNFRDSDPAVGSKAGAGPQAVAACGGTMLTAVPGATLTINSLVAEKNQVAAFWRMVSGDYVGSGISLYTFNPRTGKISRGDTRWDTEALKQEIGKVPTVKGQYSESGS